MSRVLSLTLLFFLSVNVFGQTYPQDYFRWPLDEPIELSANFCDLRGNHFHSGVDLRTQEREGLPVYAAADGYVSRIKVSPYGYGNALYLAHSKGYTTTYAHLQRYSDQITSYIKRIQYQQEKFAVEAFPQKNQIPVTKGELIGYSGNSGGSTGPHLHFEIRDARNEHPLNPLLFGLSVSDQKTPKIQALGLFDLNGPNAQLTNRFSIGPRTTSAIDNHTVVYKDTLTLPRGSWGIGIRAVDYMTSSRTYQVHQINMIVDDEMRYQCTFNDLSFSETRYINSYIDFATYKSIGLRYQKCFVDDGNALRFFSSVKNRGYLSIKTGIKQKVVLTVKDINGLYQSLIVWVKGTSTKPKDYKPKCTTRTFLPLQPNIFDSNSVYIRLESKTLYDTTYFCYSSTSGPKGSFSKLHRLASTSLPAQKYFQLFIRPETIPTGKEAKLLIVSRNKNGSIASEGGSYAHGLVKTKTRVFGDFYVSIDTIPPKVTPINFKKSGSTLSKSISVRISDNLAGISTYRATLGGRWILMKYDAKNRLLVHEIDEKTPPGKQELVLVVTDGKSNSTTFNATITITP